jgi:hypothetical protein
MNQTLTIEIPEAESARFASAIEKLATALRQIEQDDEPRWQEIDQLRAETNVLLKQIKEMIGGKETSQI